MRETGPGLCCSRLRAGTLATGILLAASAGAPLPVGAEDPPTESLAQALAERHTVPLTEADLQAITLDVVKRRPLLSASPGIKYSEAHRGFRYHQMDGAGVIRANVLYYPHFDSGGVKQAYQVQCERSEPKGRWECPWIDIRRYIRVEGQEFETRVIGDVGTDAARALIEATREIAGAGFPDSAPVPSTAIIVSPMDSSESTYLVWWGSSDGESTVGVEARLRNGGDPQSPRDWATRIFEPEAVD